MGRSRKVLLLLVLCVAVFVGMCRAWGDDDVAEDAKAKAEDAKQFATSAVHDAKEKTESWADWARDKFSDLGLDDGNEKQATQNIKYKVEDAASRATDTMKSAASGASEYASQKDNDGVDDEIIKMPIDKITDSKDTVGETMGQARERMGDSYEDAKQKMNIASDKASEKFYDAKDTIGGAMENAKDKASNVYDEARHKTSHMASGNANDEAEQTMKMASQKIYDVKDKVKGAMDYGRDKAGDAYDEAKEGINMASNVVGEKTNDAKDKMRVEMGYGRDKIDETFDHVGGAYQSAKNTMTEGAKAKYEAAKEKASEATGDLGAKMRNSPEL